MHEQPIEIHDEGVWALVRRRKRVGEQDLESGFVEVLEENQVISEARPRWYTAARTGLTSKTSDMLCWNRAQGPVGAPSA